MTIFDVSINVRQRGSTDGWDREQVNGIERETAEEAINAAIQHCILQGKEAQLGSAIATLRKGEEDCGGK